MSKLVVQHSNVDRKWMFATLRPAMSRADVLEQLHGRGYMANSDKTGAVVVELKGAFEPGCYFHNNVTITFDAHDQLEKMDYSSPVPDCL